ncbi:MAG: gamma-glutamyltransferase [Alphaproteobacteria bacterium]|nr:gamma-glutamyltransferase [Alphaproteobacteria bacterium]
MISGFFRDDPSPRAASATAPSASPVVKTVEKGDTVFFGVVAGDEPNAVLAAEKVLKLGGTAVDAATVLALSLTVTMPGAVSLGGGGVCLVHDDGKTVALDFIAPAPATKDRSADRPGAVPTLLRGVAAMHARFGSIDLRSHLGKAEQMARFGHVVSRASAKSLALAAGPLFSDPAARLIFARPDGKPYGEGDQFIQLDLAETFAKIRIGGVNSFYRGDLARQFVNAARKAGAGLQVSDLQKFSPQWRKPLEFRHGLEILKFAPSPAGAGMAVNRILAMVAIKDRYRRANEAERLHLLIEASKRAFGARDAALLGNGSKLSDAVAMMASFDAGRATPTRRLKPSPRGAPENPAQTSFVVVDLVGQAVVCTLTNYNLFGIGRVAPGFGVVLAAAPGRGNRNALSLGAVIAVSAEEQAFRFGGAASGGGAATTALARVVAETLFSEKTLERAIALPRVHHGGVPDVVLVEKSLPKGIATQLRGKGHRIESTPTLGLVNAAECPLGLGSGIEEIACFVASDPRGDGLASEAER